MSVSVLILTLNEEANLPRCLASVRWSDDVWVLDSGSTDGTIRVAETAGARVVMRPFDDYAAQRNFGLHQIVFKHDWVLMIDADEAVTDALRDEILAAVAAGGENIGIYLVRRKDFFLGRWLRHASGYPTWFARLLRPPAVRVERSVNEHYFTEGEVRPLVGHLLHYPFAKGIAAWIDKHNRYSTIEAELLYRPKGQQIALRGLFNRDPLVRRQHLKALVYRLPARPLLVFLGFYLLRGGFLDGLAGLRFCLLRACYELMISAKLAELKGGNGPAAR